MDSPPDLSAPGRKVLIGLTLALAVWGIYHAVGAYFGGFGGENLRHDFARSLVVLGCMGALSGILVGAGAHAQATFAIAPTPR